MKKWICVCFILLGGSFFSSNSAGQARSLTQALNQSISDHTEAFDNYRTTHLKKTGPLKKNGKKIDGISFIAGELRNIPKTRNISSSEKKN